jgi:hypothetical protein
MKYSATAYAEKRLVSYKDQAPLRPAETRSDTPASTSLVPSDLGGFSLALQ